MTKYRSDIEDNLYPPEEVEEDSEKDLWFLPGPIDDPQDDLPPGPRAEPREGATIAEWRRAEAGLAARLAHVAGRLGALDERLRRGPKGWRHRLALIEAADLSWFAGDRIGVDRLALWLEGMDHAILTAMTRLDDIEAWSARATEAMTRLSGRTPPALRDLLTEYPLISAPMAEALTKASRAAVQRNLIWMEEQGLIREVTGQGRFRMWRAVWKTSPTCLPDSMGQFDK